MFTDHYNGLEEYPYRGEFSRMEIPEDVPLNQQKPVKVILLETWCDIQENSHTRSNSFLKSNWSVFLPFDKDNEKISIQTGDTFVGEMYGMTVNGKVEAVFPSQLGGLKVYVNDIDV